MDSVTINRIAFKNKMQIWSEYITEASRLAGVCRALKSLTEEVDGEERFYYKLLLKSAFKDLIGRLYALTDDTTSNTDMQCSSMVRQFYSLYGAAAKGGESGFENLVAPSPNYQPVESDWSTLRNNFSAHENEEYKTYSVYQQTVSDYLERVCVLASEMQRVVFVAESVDGFIYTTTQNCELETSAAVIRLLRVTPVI